MPGLLLTQDPISVLETNHSLGLFFEYNTPFLCLELLAENIVPHGSVGLPESMPWQFRNSFTGIPTGNLPAGLV
jgi:hypothetical protein